MPVTAKKPKYQKLIDQLKPLPFDFNGMLYDRVRLLAKAWDDEELRGFGRAKQEEAIAPLVNELNRITGLHHDDLLQIYGTYPKRNQWTNGNLSEMLNESDPWKR